MCRYEEEINNLIATIDYTNIPNDIIFKKAWFRCRLSAYSRLMFDKYYTFTEEGPVKREDAWNTIVRGLPIMEMPLATSTNDFSGLYFIGMIGHPPIGENYYLVKIGQAKCIKERIKTYLTTNPMIYHDNIAIEITDSKERNLAEKRAQIWLAKFAYARAMNTDEMFYVKQDDYYYICEYLKNLNNFQKIIEEAC